MHAYISRATVLVALLFFCAGCSTTRVERINAYKEFIFNEGDAQANKTRKLMLIGDSWASFMTANHTFDQLLQDFGYDDLYCGSTALPGSKARQWASRSGLASLRGVLRKRPETKILLLTIGGNDFLELYHTRHSPAAREQKWNTVAGHVRTILKAIAEERPDMRVLIIGYTYLNLTDSLGGPNAGGNRSYFRRLGSPTPEQFNTALVELGAKIRGVAGEFERVEYAHNFGLLQYVYGLPKYDIAPESLPYPGTVASNYLPFPGGDITREGPAEGMFRVPLVFLDSIHLSGEAYYYVGKNAMLQFIAPWLKEIN